jgi:hypothetical protein
MKSSIIFLLLLCSAVFTVHAQTMRSLSSHQAAASSALRWTVTECSGRSADLAPSGEVPSFLRNSATGISVYPNPANDVLHIDLSQSAFKTEILEMEIADLMGRNLKNVSLAEGSYTAECLIQDLPEGIYLLTISCKDKVLSSLKWVKQN